MRQNSRSAGHQRKYDTARAFFTSILAISALAVWTLVPGSEKQSRRLLRRGDYPQRELHITGESEISKPLDLEVSAHRFTAICKKLKAALPVPP